MTGLTVNGGLTVTGDTTLGNLTANTIDATTFLSGGTNLIDVFSGMSNTYTTGGTVTYNGADATLTLTDNDGNPINITGFTDDFTTGATLVGTTVYFDRVGSLSAYTTDLSALSDVDTKVTAFTYDNANKFTISNSDATTFDATINTMTGLTINGTLNVTGQTTMCDILPQNTWNVNGGCDIGAVGSRFLNVYARFLKLGVSTTTLDDDGSNFTMSGTNGDFIFVPTANSVFHSDVNPDGDLTRSLGLVSKRWTELHAGEINATGLTISSLGANRVVYTNGSGGLTTEAGFTYTEGSDTILVGNMNTAAAGSAFVGTGGLIVGSGGDVSNPGNGDVTIHGNLTIFGDAITASTGELYIEDNNITLNYNPTGDTSASSIAAGFTIQDGGGTSGLDVKLDIRAMNGFTGLTGTDIPDITEYSGPTGYANRAFVTALNDLVIRSTSQAVPNGVRVLAEFDCLDGGTY